MSQDRINYCQNNTIRSHQNKHKKIDFNTHSTSSYIISFNHTITSILDIVMTDLSSSTETNNCNNIPAMSCKRKSDAMNSIAEINIDTDSNVCMAESDHLQKKYIRVEQKQALDIDEIINEEAINLIKSLSISKSSHPVCDFLTEPIISLLLDRVSERVSNHGICFFYGSGSNGKSCFVKILQNAFRCEYVSSNIFYKSSSSNSDSDVNKEETYIRQMDPKPQLLIVQESDQETIDSSVNKKNLDMVKSLGIPMIMVVNQLPRSIDRSNVENYEKRTDGYIDFKVFDFKNEYIH
jgi:hypothetical protein